MYIRRAKTMNSINMITMILTVILGIMVMLLKNGSMVLFLITVIIPLIVIPGYAYYLARM